MQHILCEEHIPKHGVERTYYNYNKLGMDTVRTVWGYYMNKEPYKNNFYIRVIWNIKITTIIYDFAKIRTINNLTEKQ